MPAQQRRRFSFLTPWAAIQTQLQTNHAPRLLSRICANVYHAYTRHKPVGACSPPERTPAFFAPPEPRRGGNKPGCSRGCREAQKSDAGEEMKRHRPRRHRRRRPQQPPSRTWWASRASCRFAQSGPSRATFRRGGGEGCFERRSRAGLFGTTFTLGDTAREHVREVE